MENITLDFESTKRLYKKVKAYEDEQLIKCTFWYTNKLEKIFNSNDYEFVLDNYINQLESDEQIFYPFEKEEETLKEYILQNYNFEEFCNNVIRYTYKRMKADVEMHDELDDDEL
jgi:hypothetical protein